MTDRKLTFKQERFIAAYLGPARGNATEAARIAGYAHPMQEGHRLLRNADIYARVTEHLDDRFATADAVLNELTKVAFAEWRENVEVQARNSDGEPVKVRMDLTSKVRALELLGKYHQLFVEKHQVDMNMREHKVGLPRSTIDRVFRPAGDPDC